jgi:C1A family cysteine protease
MRRFTVIPLVGLVLTLALCALPATAAAEPGELTAAPVSQEFLDLQAQHPFGMNATTPDGRALGHYPSPIDASLTVGLMTPPVVHKYAASYDLRNVDKVTPVKNQNPYGTCWAFAATGSMESCQMPAELRDFAEDNMARQAGFSIPGGVYDGGGNIWMSTAYLARWGGPVWESEDPYGDSITPGGLAARKHVQNVSWLPARASATDNDNIKYAVTAFGGIDVAMSWQGSTSGSSYYNPTSHAYYYNGTANTNHEVLVVGWNDNYSAANFATPPAGNGAFIVKNSWGTGWGESGYFYVSYYDTRFGRTTYSGVYHGAQSVANYTGIYQYDPLGNVNSVGIGSTTLWGANVFTAASSSLLQAVGFYAVAPNTAYEVYTGPSTASLGLRTSGTLSLMGFHTVVLPAPVAITSGQPFVVAVKFTTPGLNWPLPVECAQANYSQGATAAVGQSYYSSDGSSWTDLTTFDPTANVCLKAYSGATPWIENDDIPGTKLAGSGSTIGSLTAGTDMNDVYWFNVLAKQGIQASITGDAGTDFDLYLFPPTKTSLTLGLSGYVAGSFHTTYPDSFTYWAPSAGSYYLDVYQFSGSGAYTLTYSVLGPDTHAPSTTVGGLPAGWTTQNVTANFSANDDLSGVAYIEHSLDGAAYVHGTSVNITTEGQHTLLYRSADNAGNVEGAHSATVRIDRTAPETSAAGIPASGWASGSVPVTFTATDGGSLVAYTEYSVDGGGYVHGAGVTISGAGAHTLLYRSADNVGNVEAPKTATVTIETTAPTSTVLGLTAAGWTRSDVSLTLQASDDNSGVAKIEYQLGAGAWATYGAPVVVSAEGETLFSYRAIDNAGNTEAAKSATVRIDKTGPSTVAGNRISVKKGKKATFRFSLKDRTATAKVTIKIFKGRKLKKSLTVGSKPCGRPQSYAWKRCTLAKGSYTWKVYATDEAGNAQSRAGSKGLTVQ